MWLRIVLRGVAAECAGCGVCCGVAEGVRAARGMLRAAGVCGGVQEGGSGWLTVGPKKWQKMD